MFKQLFATMHDVLDDIAKTYPAASPSEQQSMQEQMSLLKAMSETCMEEWLKFDEKMTDVLEKVPDFHALLALPGSFGGAPLPFIPEEARPEAFRKGQGYFNLSMFEHAIKEFGKALAERPDFPISRLYLAVCYLELEQLTEAERHFIQLIESTDHPKLLASAYNALGCIAAKNQDKERALACFKIASKTDPGLIDPLINIAATLGSGSAMTYGDMLES